MRDAPVYNVYRSCVLIAVTEDTEEVEEEVDEVEVECEGTDCGELANSFRCSRHSSEFNLLGIPCGKADEDEYTGDRYDPVERAAVQEDVDYRRDDEAKEGHDKVGANAREVVGCEIAVDTHRAEGTCGDEEGLGDYAWAIGKEYCA